MRVAHCYAPDAMAQQQGGDARPVGDPWHAFGYLVAGVGFYGALGFLADRLLHTSFLVAIGIVIGAAFGVYLTWTRFSQTSDNLPATDKEQA